MFSIATVCRSSRIYLTMYALITITLCGGAMLGLGLLALVDNPHASAYRTGNQCALYLNSKFVAPRRPALFIQAVRGLVLYNTGRGRSKYRCYVNDSQRPSRQRTSFPNHHLECNLFLPKTLFRINRKLLPYSEI
jgi:hypothetical protein